MVGGGAPRFREIPALAGVNSTAVAQRLDVEFLFPHNSDRWSNNRNDTARYVAVRMPLAGLRSRLCQTTSDRERFFFGGGGFANLIKCHQTER